MDYTYAKNVTTLVYEIDEISITNINTNCNGQDIQFDLLDDADGPVVSGSGTVAAGAYTYQAAGDNIPVVTELGKVTVIIG